MRPRARGLAGTPKARYYRVPEESSGLEPPRMRQHDFSRHGGRLKTILAKQA